MAANYYLNIDGNWTNTANWSRGSVPDNTDTVYILEGAADRVIATNLPAATAGINYAGLVIGPRFRGKIGSASTPLYIGSVTASIKFDGALCQECHLAVDTGDSSSIEILSCGSGPYALSLSGAGTWANIYGQATAGFVRVGTTTFTTTWNLGGLLIYVEAGATFGTMYQMGPAARAEILCAVGTLLESHGGNARLIAAEDKTYALLKVWGGRVSHEGSASPTITAAHVGGGGTLDMSGGSGKPATITSLYRYSGGNVIKPANSAALTVTNDYQFGGELTTAPGGGFGSA